MEFARCRPYRMRHLVLRVAATLAASLAMAPAASAAHIRLAKTPSGMPLPGVTIEGPIAPGDFVQFAALVLTTPDANTVWLASGGGNLSEALRIGRLIRQLAMAVQAPIDRERPLVQLARPENNTCASACFFLYAAGVRRSGSVLGIHKPSLPADEYFALGLDGSVDAHQRIEAATAAYLQRMGVPPVYTSMMLAAGSAEMVWLSRDEIDRDLTGVVREYAHLVETACEADTAKPAGTSTDCASRLLADIQNERRFRTREQLLGRESLPAAVRVDDRRVR